MSILPLHHCPEVVDSELPFSFLVFVINPFDVLDSELKTMTY